MNALNAQNQTYDDFLTVQEAAQLLRSTPKTLYTYLSNTGKYNGKPRKRLPKEIYRKIGRKILFLREELINWVLDGAKLENVKEAE